MLTVYRVTQDPLAPSGWCEFDKTLNGEFFAAPELDEAIAWGLQLGFSPVIYKYCVRHVYWWHSEWEKKMAVTEVPAKPCSGGFHTQLAREVVFYQEDILEGPLPLSKDEQAFVLEYWHLLLIQKAEAYLGWAHSAAEFCHQAIEAGDAKEAANYASNVWWCVRNHFKWKKKAKRFKVKYFSKSVLTAVLQRKSV